MDFSPLVRGLTIPLPYPWENHFLFIMVAVSIAGWVHLIKDAYLHDAETNMCHISRYIIGNDSNRRT